ncbi:MAG: cell division/cell wall cluster transcriptional repressor MraZ [Spirochaetales bacterium]|uniref:division/cell wall cluster transcriptional repressor MraZ n=1 Tax=Bullifex sp. TaxID=2815808 RepID=UPI002A573D34|nr:cell division/cell wall cluster transcriptional repressor MraZ [Bullifex sp.]MDD5972237.1 cell division/cell wall cluster transcriptional repressor MraZ [Spirochaetales bacterium]MDD7270666.1 cell division/cell wall cluster transcriptional repressor MraZ [Spirochaetales bacterium]MDY4067904.1 cell division/cell wall cluster transcriptional repressor MraZ [Bullifex sp.]
MLLTGEYIVRVDEKGRVSIPSKLRTLLGVSQIVVTKGFDGNCLAIFTPQFFDETVTNAIAGQDGLQILSPVVRKFTRKFVSPSQVLDIDSNGRINIPLSLREHASIGVKEEIILIGMGKYIELWNKEMYEDLDSDESISELAQELAEMKRS